MPALGLGYSAEKIKDKNAGLARSSNEINSVPVEELAETLEELDAAARAGGKEHFRLHRSIRNEKVRERYGRLG